MSATHRFKCSCGKVNQFKVEDGPERSVKVRCGACKQICRMTVPEADTKKQIRALIDGILGRMGVCP